MFREIVVAALQDIGRKLGVVSNSLASQFISFLGGTIPIGDISQYIDSDQVSLPRLFRYNSLVPDLRNNVSTQMQFSHSIAGVITSGYAHK